MKKDVELMLNNTNETETTNAVIRYESLKLFNAICQFENGDKGSVHYNASPISRLVKMFTGESDEVNVSSDLINKFIELPEGQAKNIKDVFYKTNDSGVEERRSEAEIDILVNPLKEVVRKYQPTALQYTHITMHDTQLTLSEHLDISRQKLEERELLIDNEVNYDEVNKINRRFKSEMDSIEAARNHSEYDKNPMLSVAVGMGEDKLLSESREIKVDHDKTIRRALNRKQRR